jgi:hypothetical protein
MGVVCTCKFFKKYLNSILVLASRTTTSINHGGGGGVPHNGDLGVFAGGGGLRYMSILLLFWAH